MADTDQIAIVPARSATMRLAGLALSTEAHWNQNEADWRFFLATGYHVRRCATAPANWSRTAALLPYTSEQCLDQHGAGDAKAGAAAGSRPGWSMPASTPRPNGASRPGSTRRRRAPAVYGPLGFTPTLQLRRLRLEHALDRSSRRAAAMPVNSSSIHHAAISTPWVSIAAICCANSAGARARGWLSNGDAMALVRDGRKARHIGPLFAEAAGAGARDGAMPSRPRDRPAADRRRREPGRISERPDAIGLDHRAAVSAHAIRPRHHAGPANCRSPSPAPNMDREEPMHHSQIESEVRRLIARGHGDPGASARARRRPQRSIPSISAR